MVNTKPSVVNIKNLYFTDSTLNSILDKSRKNTNFGQLKILSKLTNRFVVSVFKSNKTCHFLAQLFPSTIDPNKAITNEYLGDDLLQTSSPIVILCVLE